MLFKPKPLSLKFEDNFSFRKRVSIRLNDVIGGIITWLASTIATATAASLAGVSALYIAQAVVYGVIIAAVAYSVWSTYSSSRKSGGSSYLKNLDQNGNLVNTKLASEPLRVVYGKYKVGGNWVFCDSSRDNNNYLNIVLTWSEGECEGIASGLDYTSLFTGSGRNDLKIGGEYTGSTSCSCNATCYGYGACSCNMTCYGFGGGKDSCTSCDLACYGYIPCSCNSSCYGYGEAKFKVEIDGASTPDTFKWSDDGGLTWEATGVAITGAWQDLNNGAKIKFESLTGHTLTNNWMFWGGDGIWIGERLINYYHDYSGSNLIDHEFFHGTDEQYPSSELQKEIPAWNEAIRFTCYSRLRLYYNTNAFKSIPEMTCLLKGRKLYDPRDGSTTWSRNPALVWYDFMTNTRYGMAIPSSLIDTDSVSDVANWCDSHGFYFDGAVMDRQAFLDNLEDMLTNFHAYVIWSGGQFKLQVQTDDAAVMSLTDADIEISPESFSIYIPGIPETPNKVKCIFSDKEENYTTNYVFWESESQISLDGTSKVLEIPLIGTIDKTQARKLAKYYLLRNTYNKQFKILGHPRCFALEPGDMVSITHEFPDWTDKKLRVMEMGIPQDGKIPLTLIDENSAIYNETV